VRRWDTIGSEISPASDAAVVRQLLPGPGRYRIYAEVEEAE